MPSSLAPFPAKCYQQLFVGDERSSRPLGAAEDGAHWLPGDKFFEWWYFDAHLDNGYQVVIAWHTRLFNVISRPSILTTHLYSPEGQKAVQLTVLKPGEVKSAVERCDVQMGASRVWDAGDRYIIHLEQERIRASLEYYKEVEGVQIGTGILFADDASGQSFHWVIPMPRARVVGQVWVDGECIAASGVGYHDHNWGNLDLGDAFPRWIWGRAAAGDYTLVFGNLLGRGTNAQVTLLGLWQGSRLALCTNQHITHFTESELEERTDLRYPSQIELRASDAALSAQATLRACRMLDVADFARPRSQCEGVRRITEKLYFLAERVPRLGRLAQRWIGYATYLRLQADCELVTAIHGWPGCARGNAFCEMMNFEFIS